MKLEIGDPVKVLPKSGISESVIGKKGYVIDIEIPDYPVFVRLEDGHEMSFAEWELEKIREY